MLKDINDVNVIFTYSWWDSEDDLNNYRTLNYLKMFGVKQKYYLTKSQKLGVQKK